MQERRHPGDHLVPDEPGEDEDVELDDGGGVHQVPRCRTWPSCVTHIGPAISSLRSGAKAPSFRKRRMKVLTFRLNICEACRGIVAGRFTGPRTFTPPTSTASPARVRAQFPPVSAARSTMTAPGFIPCTIASVMS